MTLYEQLYKKLKHTIVVIGDAGVGKSALTIRLVTNNFLQEYEPTIEDCYHKQVIIDGKEVLLEIIDTAGMEEFNAMHDEWIKQGDAFLIIYSITSLKSFEKCILLQEKVLRVKDEYEPNKIFPIVLVGNKCDLEDDREVDIIDANEIASQWRAPFFESSAKKGINNSEIFYQCVRYVFNLFFILVFNIQMHIFMYREIRKMENRDETKKILKKRKKLGCLFL